FWQYQQPTKAFACRAIESAAQSADGARIAAGYPEGVGAAFLYGPQYRLSSIRSSPDVRQPERAGAWPKRQTGAYFVASLYQLHQPILVWRQVNQGYTPITTMSPAGRERIIVLGVACPLEFLARGFVLLFRKPKGDRGPARRAFLVGASATEQVKLLRR